MFKQFTGSKVSSEDKVISLATKMAIPVSDHDALSQADKTLIEYLELKSQLHDVLLDRLNLAAIEKVQPEELRREVANLVSQALSEKRQPMQSEAFNTIVNELMDEVLGLGPLEP
ncbi:MAG: CpaF family protein, partial [Amylibacter sp.]